MARPIAVFNLIIVFLILAAPASAQDVTLAWDPNAETDLAGYKVYIGNASRTYGTPVVIGTQTTYTFTGLVPGTYYFAVTAVNTAGLESGFSNEVWTTLSSGTSPCDANGDQSVNVLDLQVMINVILGVNSGTPSQDLNRDGRIDVLDLQILANVVLGVRSCP
jgi:hypothetical protein